MKQFTFTILKRVWDIFFYLYMGWAIPNSISKDLSWNTAFLSFCLGSVVVIHVLSSVVPQNDRR